MSELIDQMLPKALTWRDAWGATSKIPFVLDCFAGIPVDRRGGVKVLDLPSGSGVISGPLRAAGFDVTSADLFPQYQNEFTRQHAGEPLPDPFQRLAKMAMPAALRARLLGHVDDPRWPSDLDAVDADMAAPLPFGDGGFDVTVCVEGIEHVTDRHATLDELRRVTRTGGALVLTTPNTLSLRSRMAFALAGSDRLHTHIDEYTSVWGVSEDGHRIYHGHAFLVNYYQLRYSLHHCGFRLRAVFHSPWSPTSVLLSPVAPLVAWATKRTQRKAKRRFDELRANGEINPRTEPPFDQMYRHALSPPMLYGKTLMLLAEAVDAGETMRHEHRHKHVTADSSPTPPRRKGLLPCD